MSRDLISMGIVLAALGVLVGTLAVMRRKRMIGGEFSRKGVHVGMGCLTTAFPWMFERSMSVWILAVVACLTMLGLVCIPAFKSVLKAVDRDTYGEFYFPIAIAFAFHYSGGDPVLYCPPVLMLAFGDSMAAIIGRHYGKRPFTTHEGPKSWEGSVAFVIATFAFTLVTLAILSDYSIFKILLVSVLLGLIGFMIEGFAWKGLDNLLIPVFGVIAMQAFHIQEESGMILRVVMILALIGICFAFKRRSTLNDSALLGAALVFYLIWATAGWSWALSPLIVFFLFPRVVKFDYRLYRDFQSVTSLVGIVIVSFFWLAQSMRSDEGASLIWPFTSGFAIHLSLIWAKRAKTQARPRYVLNGIFLYPLLATGAVQLIPILIDRSGRVDQVFVFQALAGLSVCSAMTVCVVFWKRFDAQRMLNLEEWTFRNLLALAGSTALWIVV